MMIAVIIIIIILTIININVFVTPPYILFDFRFDSLALVRLLLLLQLQRILDLYLKCTRPIVAAGQIMAHSKVSVQK